MRPQDKIGVHAWTNFYAAFSERFVNAALDAMGATEDSNVLDPFVGSGTTVVTALRRGMRATGIDLDPFACLLTRAKIARRVSRKTVLSLLKRTGTKQYRDTFHEAARTTFSVECLSYASAVFRRVYERTATNRETCLAALLSDTDGRFDSEVVALVALSIGASGAAQLIRGSNPTWFRAAVKGELCKVEHLAKSTAEAVDRMLVDLTRLKIVTSAPRVRLINRDFVRLSPSEIGLVDHIVTSPPYLTRMDYVVKHLPNLLILSGLIQIDFDDLRRKMIGTSKINEKSEDNVAWGSHCLSTLRKIGTHPSYASHNYYVWTYRQYFAALYTSLQKLCATLRPGGTGLIVIQDALYKDLHIELSVIVKDMLMELGVHSEVAASIPVLKNLRSLNPAHAKHRSTTRIGEHIVYFRKKLSTV